jgi:hypothetical protein
MKYYYVIKSIYYAAQYSVGRHYNLYLLDNNIYQAQRWFNQDDNWISVLDDWVDKDIIDIILDRSINHVQS